MHSECSVNFLGHAGIWQSRSWFGKKPLFRSGECFGRVAPSERMHRTLESGYATLFF
jgi:hypothetical protein